MIYVDVTGQVFNALPPSVAPVLHCDSFNHHQPMNKRLHIKPPGTLHTARNSAEERDRFVTVNIEPRLTRAALIAYRVASHFARRQAHVQRPVPK